MLLVCLRLARGLGFRTLLYFGDGLLEDSGSSNYHPDWAYVDAHGHRLTGWYGPDTIGPTYVMNPANPQVVRFCKGCLDALLRTYGADLDVLVWDETFYVRVGQIATKPEPAYCDRAMMALV